ncbi:unnamed protein product [Diamesa hyperborea]
MKLWVCIVIISLFSIVVLAKILNFTQINEFTNSPQKHNYWKNDWKLDDSPDKMMWFLQISDLHISKFSDLARIKDLQDFCGETVDVIKPSVVLASGDLTDAKDEFLGSQQYIEEWKSYYSALVDSNVLNKTKWLDIRGNHDNFNVESFESRNDLYQNFSAQGRQNKRSYMKQITVDELQYSFIAIDASVEPGLKRPFHFIGMLSDTEVNRIERLAQSTQDNGSNYTVWFSHYPTSCVMTPSNRDTIRNIVGKYNQSMIYVAGHLHTMGGLIKRMYTLQPNGFLELELGDFMRKRLFRIGVFDHGLFSFVDVKHRTWPVAIITNPKNLLYNNPYKENPVLALQSTHIRVLAFSPDTITECRIRINEGSWQKCEKKTESFFVLQWNPVEYKKGKHKMELFIGDSSGKVFVQEQYFSLDGTRMGFDLTARFVLMGDVTTIFKTAFGVAFTLCLIPLLSFRTWYLLVKYGKLPKPGTKFNQNKKKFLQKLWILASLDRMFYGLLFYLLYILVGPWSFHPVIDGHIGYIFLWGTFVNGSFLPGTLSYFYGAHQLTFFVFPLIFIYADILMRRFKFFLSGSVDEEAGTMKTIRRNLSFFAVLTVEFLLAMVYFGQYGFISFIIAPIRTWGLIFSLFLFYQAKSGIPDRSFKQSLIVWSAESKLSTS